MTPLEEKRLKRAYISTEMIVDLFVTNPPEAPQEKNNWTFLTAALVLKAVPEDYQIHHVEFDYCRMAFAVVMSSAEWPVVAHGDMIPMIDTQTRQVYVDHNGKIIGVGLIDETDGYSTSIHQGRSWRDEKPLF